MEVRVLNLDRPSSSNESEIDLRDWAPCVRMTCRFDTWRRFTRDLHDRLGDEGDGPALRLIGSGDFHHVTLALLQRQQKPFNLLILDKHPDWMRGIPVMHCGTWVRHALRLPNLRRVFHVGGDLDFDNAWRTLAPWSDLQSGRVTVVPAYRRFTRGRWRDVEHRPLLQAGSPSIRATLDALLGSRRRELAECPLYVSLDKDVMSAAEATVNWDSGSLAFGEVLDVLDWFRTAADGRLTGMDIVGDWSPVKMRFGLRTLCHWTEHPRLEVDAAKARARNDAMNMRLADWFHRVLVEAGDLVAA